LLEDVERHLDDTHIAWIGGAGDDDAFYVIAARPSSQSWRRGVTGVDIWWWSSRGLLINDKFDCDVPSTDHW